MKLVDLSAATCGPGSFVEANIDNALGSLKQYGIVVIHSAFEPELISDFLTNSVAYGSYIETCIRSGEEPEVSPFHAFNNSTLACNITALDPHTAPTQVNDLTRTSLYKAVMTEFVQSIVRAVMGQNLGWTLARVRVVLPDGGEVDGRLGLHMEKYVARYPGLHNIWVPITTEGRMSNVDVPGIQFLIGKAQFFESISDEEATDFLGSLQDRKNGDFLEIDTNAFLYRPVLQTGDIAIFSGDVPHGGHIPSEAKASRVGCDFRLFPWTDVDYSKGRTNLKATQFMLA